MRPEEACGGEATRAVGALAVSIGNPYVPGSSVLCCAGVSFVPCQRFHGIGSWRPAASLGGGRDERSMVGYRLCARLRIMLP
jgi:hypothetical protein